MTRYFRALATDISGEPGTPIRFTATTDALARDGLVIELNGWQLDNYRANPVILWAHDYQGERPPIGRGDVDGWPIVAVTFDQADEFARQIERKYRDGFLNAVSVGWDTGKKDDNRIIQAELLDISAVPVPGDPGALIERQRAGLRSLRAGLDDILGDGQHGAHPPHSTAKAAEGVAWSASAEVGMAEGAAQLWRMHAWRDDDADPETKRAYKLPHHLASGQVVWRGVAAAMSRLLQAGTQIPDSDRRGVYNHLKRHYGQFDKEPPEFRTAEEIAILTPELWRGLFLEGEIPEPVDTRHLAELKAAYDALGNVIEQVEAGGEQEPPDDDDSAAMAVLEQLSQQLEETNDGLATMDDKDQ